MSAMGDVAIIIDEAKELGVTLTLGNFGRDADGRLTINKVEAREWLSRLGNHRYHSTFCSVYLCGDRAACDC